MPGARAVDKPNNYERIHLQNPPQKEGAEKQGFGLKSTHGMGAGHPKSRSTRSPGYQSEKGIRKDNFPD